MKQINESVIIKLPVCDLDFTTFVHQVLQSAALEL